MIDHRYRVRVPVLSLDEVLDRIMDRPACNGIRIVGVDGPSGSGKSTLARRLAGRAGAPLIEIDDFGSWVDFAGWWPRFDEQVLTPLLAGEDAHYQVRDWDNDEFGDSLAGWKTVAWAPLVVIEGVTCTRAATAGRLAYRIWVEAPDALRLQRGVARDGESHRALWLDWMIEEGRFFDSDATRTRADLKVDGSPATPHDPDNEVVLIADVV